MGVCCSSLNRDQISKPAIVQSPQKLEPIIASSTQAKITEFYTIEGVIGFGVFGTVRKGYLKSIPSRVVAVKSIDKSKFTNESQITRLKSEMEILQAVDHPNIIRLYEIFEDVKYIHIVTEYCEGGELFERIMAKGKYSEREAGKIMQAILRAVHNLHLNQISHRDIKPENFLFVSKEDNAELKLIDFGLSSRFSVGNIQTMESMVGTPYYVSPEVLYGPTYGPSCDIWSAGVIMYVLLTGDFPFGGSSHTEIFQKIKSGKYAREGEAWDSLSEHAKDLISKLIVLNPNERINAESALKHPWFDPTKDDRKVDHNILRSLRSYRAFSKLQNEAMAVIVKYLANKDLKELRDAFIQLDKNNTGFLTFDEIEQVLETSGCLGAKDEIHEIIKNANHRGSAEINYSEFLVATLNSKMKLNEELMWNAFKHFDVDNSGSISAQDLMNALRKTGRNVDYDQVMEMIDELELENDTVDFRDFKKMLSRINDL